jgi:hypothetical protein
VQKGSLRPGRGESDFVPVSAPVAVSLEANTAKTKVTFTWKKAHDDKK